MKRQFILAGLLLILLSLPLVGEDVWVVPIEGDIEASTVVFIRRGIQQARSSGAETIIFRINTFGGRVDSALQIATLIGSVDEARTVAFIPAAAEGLGVSWSAGALISFACSEIYMAPGTSIGAAAPVYQTAEGMEMAPEKSVSAVRTQLAALAEKNGYPLGVGLAMVDEDVVLQEVYIGGELRLVTSDELSQVKRQAEKDELSFEEGMVLVEKEKLLTLTAGQMEKYGISSGTVADVKELAGVLGYETAAVEYQSYDPFDRFVILITSAGVVSILMLIGLVATYLEITSPGFGIPGTVAILAYSVVFLGSALIGYFDSLELILLLVGIALLAVEIFVIPGFGAAGIGGIVSIAAALIFSQQDFIVPEFSWQTDILLKNAARIGLIFLGSFTLFGLTLLVAPRTGIFRRLVLGPAGPGSSIPMAGTAVPAEQERKEGVIRTGDQGETISGLRPSGTARIAGRRVSVQTQGEFLEAGIPVKVVEVQGNRIVVRERKV
ncbi:NfeD family protein [Marispirochaeta sp.]|uniref:NfeD family protein n=1 Tax=Marispirochaeta sp. TaxID=2038653 RepID=UPI0029C6850B|nr:NfeD family protein [Marispirochaeta sp.]